MNDRFHHHIWPCFEKKNLAIVICKSVSHFAPSIGILLALLKDLIKPTARLMKKMSNIPKSFEQRPCVLRMFFFSHLLLKGPYSQEMLYWKSQGHNVRCHLREENSNVAKIVSTVATWWFSGRLLGQNRFLSFGHQTVDLGMRKTACGKTWDLRWW